MTRQTFVFFDLHALEESIARHPLTTSLAVVDRMLVACILGDFEEARSLYERSRLLLNEAGGETTNRLVACALLEDSGVDVDALRVQMAPAVLAVRDDVERWPEPMRSVHLYWQQRARMGPGFVIGRAPIDRYLALYHHAHTVFFAARYGEARVPRAACADALLLCLEALDDARCRDNADCVAEVLLAEACVAPADEALRERLMSELARLQLADGSMRMPDEASADARHHAACVTRAAVTLVRRQRATSSSSSSSPAWWRRATPR